MNETIQPPVLCEFAGGVATVTLNRPDRLNSFNDAMHDAIAAFLDRIEHDPALRVLVFTGAGRAFCAGQDQGDRQPLPEGQKRDMGAALERYYKPLVLRLRALPAPVVCAMNGLAVGVGATLVLACDIVIARESAYFVQGFTKLGLMPDGGASQFLPQRIGTARALALCMLNDKLPARQAADWGLIWRCVPDDEFEAASSALVAQLAGSATRALAMTKQAIYAAAGNTLGQQLDLETASQRALGYTDDYQEGAAAFREKRSADFKGR
ncbi:enoyl-CoA hydratase-related protein [Herbaspirillum robiniae]|uniref:2-(1,2-epoxy-1,2-dihydrophenyl)acetyl-CoA isomerase n=1 Tax=Herbaspirillum robiniae TaxID=2014887 RepID=A0A246WNJ3_9BURK|nr:enoyl-CoA hydratase-related protein [Herbaspirillum robiniae]NUU04307.1 2-(1,2-epoxy-1,2-dihydrophenyl)acetyl-CoA isomerase [Herbaspirillum robiniae]OWY27918.1 2-(1,2-epoxy-1,2-dihydrophenyl)acetyl-CoA isomerase [Herbaspirillum robiniae]